MNIKVIYIYPDEEEVYNEINLFRIIDEDLKETLVFYTTFKNSSYNINMYNTMMGSNTIIYTKEKIEDISEYINKIRVNEKDIKAQGNLEKIEKYILNLT